MPDLSQHAYTRVKSLDLKALKQTAALNWTWLLKQGFDKAFNINKTIIIITTASFL